MMVASDRVAPRNPEHGALRGEVNAAPGSQAECAFAHALREKSLAADDAETGNDADGSDGGTDNRSGQSSALTCPIAPFPGLPELSPAHGCDQMSSGPMAGVEAAPLTTATTAAAAAAQSIPAPTVSDADSTTWEASVRDGSGVALELRAESAPTGPGEYAAWAVTVVSPTLAAEILERHAPDLTERLRRRGIASRVRIEGALKERGGRRE